MQSVEPPSTTDNPSKSDYWNLHMEKWKHSKLKQQTYCEQAGISYTTFVYWRGLLLSRSPKTKKEKFVPIKIMPDKSSIQNAPQAIQVKLLSGHIVYIPSTLGIQEIAALIKLLGTAHA
jgi:hypothetical protein